MDITKVDLGVLQVFQMFFQNVSSVSDYVASVLIWMLHMFHKYIAKQYVPNVSAVLCLMLQ
jgi:hypothetical protein